MADTPTNNVRDQLVRMILNAMSMSRGSFARSLMDPRRSIDDECGYPSAGNYLDAQLYQQFYDRDPIGARVVEVYPSESWQVQPTVYEEESAEKVTEFEEAWDALGKGLRGTQSWYQEEEGSPIWSYLERADILSGIGHYGVILLGLNDDEYDLSQPVKGLKEEHTVPAGFEVSHDGSGQPIKNQLPDRHILPGPYRMTVNAKSKEKRELLYLRVFPESLAQATQFEANPTSPRYGQPTQYLLTFNDPKEGSSAGIGLTTATRTVHWSRIIHIADVYHAANSSEVFAIPRMQQVLNRVYDCQKVYGADAEAYWRGAILKLFLGTDPALGGDVSFDATAVKDQLENMMNGLQQWMITNGFTPQTVAPSVVDPTSHLAVQIQAICIKKRIPQRVFMGSERGELASGQDDAAWNDRLKARQRQYITPGIIVRFVDRCILLGVLPTPKRYGVWWPDLTSQSDQEKATVATTRLQAFTAYISGGIEAIMTPLDFLTREMKYSDEEALTILENAAKAQEEKEAEEAEKAEEQAALAPPPAPPAPGQPPNGVPSAGGPPAPNEGMLPPTATPPEMEEVSNHLANEVLNHWQQVEEGEATEESPTYGTVELVDRYRGSQITANTRFKTMGNHLYNPREMVLDVPIRTPRLEQPYAVAVKNSKGRVVVVRFGKGIVQGALTANAALCNDPGPHWEPRYWACRLATTSEVELLSPSKSVTLSGK